MKQLAGLVLLAAWASLGCRSDESRPRPGKGAGLEIVRINRLPLTSFGPIFLAKEAGDFEREGIDLSLVEADFGTLPVALASKQLDVVASAPRTAFFNLMAKGMPVRIVADRGHAEAGACTANAFAAPPGTAARIARSGLRGERFLMRRGGNMEHLTQLLIEQAGLTPADVKLTPMVAEEALSTVEAVMYLPEPMLSGSMIRDGLQIVSRVEELAPGYQLGVLFFGKRMLENRELGERFMRAYLRGVERYREGKTDRNVDVLSRDTKLPPDILRRACWETIAADGRVDLASVDDYLRWARKAGYIDAEVPSSTWWDPSFVERAQRGDRMQPAEVTQ